jgi:cation diffusion facilitator family transporter
MSSSDFATPSAQPAPKFTAGEAKQARRLAVVLVVVTMFFVVELAGALAARSRVLQADALHLLMDVLALGMSLLAMRLAVRRPTARFTFGLRRAEPVAAIFNAVLVVGASIEIVRDGVEGLSAPEAPRSGLMLVVAIAALVVNGISAWLLHGVIQHPHGHDHGHGHGHGHGHDRARGHGHEHGHEHEDEHTRKAARGEKRRDRGHHLNLRGAWLHLLGDTLGSLAALVAAIVIRSGGPVIVDPIGSFVVVGILLVGAGRLVRDAVLVLLEAAPAHVHVGAVREVITDFPDVAGVHDLHVWTLGAGHDAITAHVRAKKNDPRLARRLSHKLREAFDVEYVTVQVEVDDEACGAPESRYEGSAAS